MDEFDFQAEEDGLWNRLVAGLRRASKWQFVIKIVLILGGTLISVIGAALEGPLFPSPPAAAPDAAVGLITTKGVMVISGALAAAVGGAVLLFVDWDTPELLDKAKAYVRQVRVYLDERDALLKLDDKRRALLDMQTDIYEGCEVIGRGEDIDLVAQTILNLGSAHLPASIGFELGERWAFSIFRRQEVDGEECMKRVAVFWADRQGEQRPGRTWAKREGFTGWAWHDGQELIVEDVNAVEWDGKFAAPAGKTHKDDGQRYVSAAAIPIKVGATDEIWGVVTATSDIAKRFRRNPHDVKSQNVETVRVLARLIATQVAMRSAE